MRESLAHQFVFGTIIALTIATFVGFLGEFGWFFDLASHFRLQFSSLGLLLATLYIFRLKTKLAFYCLILMFINIFPLWSTTEKGNAGHLNPTASQSVIVSFNLDRQNINYDSVITYLSGSNADILFLTEVTAAWRPRLRKLQEVFPYHFEVPEWIPSEEQDSKLWWRKGDPAMSIALFSKIPIAHIHGGETTLGVFDESIRHSITKMSWWHFVAAKDYKKRVEQLGEDPNRVFNVGGLGVDAIKKAKLLSNSFQLELLLFLLNLVTGFIFSLLLVFGSHLFFQYSL